MIGRRYMTGMRNCQHCRTELTANQRKNCAKCSLEAKHIRNHKWHANNKRHRSDKDKTNHRSPSYRWHLLKQNGKKRNLEVTLTRDQFEEVSKQPCHYCNGVLDTDSGWGSHIDRLDNNLGYTIENSVSCCDFCNRIKQDLLTPNENEKVIELIVRMRKTNAANDLYTPDSRKSSGSVSNFTEQRI